MKLNFGGVVRKYGQSRLFLVTLYGLLALALFITAFTSIRPALLDVQLLSVADQTITSPQTIVDTEETERKRQEAADQVEDVYTFEDATDLRVTIVTAIFDEILRVREEAANSEEEVTIDEMVDQLIETVSAINEALTEEEIATLLGATDVELEVARGSITTAVQQIMSSYITITQVQAKRQEIVQHLANTNVRQPVREALQSLGRYAIVANYFFNQEETDLQKEAAHNAVEPVTILQGQVIVREGEIITNDVYRQLQLLGLTEHTAASYQPYVGLFLIVFLLIFYVFTQARMLGYHKQGKLLNFSAYAFIVIVTLGLMRGVSFFQGSYANIGYLVPIAVGTILVYLVVHPRLVFPTALIFAVLGSVVFNEGVAGTLNFSIGIYYLFSSSSVLFFLESRRRNRTILRAGLFVSLINLGTIFGVMMLKSMQYSWISLATLVILAIASGMLSSILAVGSLPYLEDGFGKVSHMKLMELSSPNHPLLREILLKAPGTYHHSIMVANLAEAACEAIGADGLLARVGSYYHDIGKTAHPHFFIENQMGLKNPHDMLTPEESKDIILAHVTDGVEILEKNRMPKEIIDFCKEHHGTTFLKYFYVKAKEEGDAVQPEDFRYPGPTPRTKETAVVGIADSVEAAVRSLTPPTPENIENLVRSIINERLEDGQFDNCDLTMKELHLIQKSLCETLSGTFHSRIKYPELKKT